MGQANYLLANILIRRNSIVNVPVFIVKVMLKLLSRLGVARRWYSEPSVMSYNTSPAAGVGRLCVTILKTSGSAM